MGIETPKIIIDDNLELDVNTGIIGQGISENAETVPVFPTEEIISQLDKLDCAVNDLQSSFDSYSISRLSNPGREGTYHTAGLLTNIVLGIILALIIILLLV